MQESNTTGKYLGMPMVVGKNKHSTFSFLVDRVAQKLQAWSSQNISKAGKIILLKSAAQSIPNFWMSLLRIPGEICDKIEKCMNAYWWRSEGRIKGLIGCHGRGCVSVKSLAGWAFEIFQSLIWLCWPSKHEG